MKEQTEAMGTDPQEFLGYNPFTASIEIKLHSDYANSDSIAKIEKLIKRNTNIQDVLYQKEQPVLILDDPFTNLDPEKIRQALDLLREIAGKRQVLYFTCHESRMPQM